MDVRNNNILTGIVLRALNNNTVVVTDVVDVDVENVANQSVLVVTVL